MLESDFLAAPSGKQNSPWEIIADNLHDADWLGLGLALDREGRTI
jgi:hypothetical protein